MFVFKKLLKCYEIIFGVISDKNILEELKPWQDEISIFSETVIGNAKEPLNGERAGESNLANFVADSMVHYVSKQD